MAHLLCARPDCGELVMPPRRKFCSDNCSNTQKMRRYRAKQSPTADLARRMVELEGQDKPIEVTRAPRKESTVDGRRSARRGQGYDRFVEQGWADRIANGYARNADAAYALDCQASDVARWMAAYREDLKVEQARRSWSPSAENVALLDGARLPDFRAKFFRTPDHTGAASSKPYETPPFQQNWSNIIEEARAAGTRKAILASPRHGKTDLLAHKAIQMICRNPNIRILWVGGNEDIAAAAVNLVAEELEHNEALREAYCPPGASFRPPARSGKSWGSGVFTVATRTLALRSPTMVAVGKSGKLLSRDADLIVVDDIVDDKSTRQPAQREADLRWFRTQLSSRKEPHTGIVVIGSRQHPEDLYGELLSDSTFDVHVFQAHDDGCDLPAEDIDRHTDCVLFPSLRPYSWLMEQRATMGATLYEMVYLNRARAEGATIFNREHIEACRDRSRRIGDIPPGTRLIVGLDPAPKGYQAAVLWAVHVESNTRFLVDIQNEKAGGTPHLRAIIADWATRYGVKEWCVEQNIIDDTLRHDTVIRELRDRLNIRFIPHITGRNKWDAVMGITTQATLFERGLINLPYGDAETRGRVEVYINQLVNFSGARTSHMTNWKSDIVMAGWFPEKTIQDWQREFVTDMGVAYAQTSYQFDTQMGW